MGGAMDGGMGGMAGNMGGMPGGMGGMPGGFGDAPGGLGGPPGGAGGFPGAPAGAENDLDAESESESESASTNIKNAGTIGNSNVFNKPAVGGAGGLNFNPALLKALQSVNPSAQLNPALLQQLG